jgi:hypothetical protein
MGQLVKNITHAQLQEECTGQGIDSLEEYYIKAIGGLKT